MTEPSQILIIRPGAIGDTILSLSAFNCILNHNTGVTRFVVSAPAIPVIDKFIQVQGIDATVYSIEDPRLLSLFSDSSRPLPPEWLQKEKLGATFNKCYLFYNTIDEQIRHKAARISSTVYQIQTFQSGTKKRQWRFLTDQIDICDSTPYYFKKMPVENEVTTVWLHPGAGSIYKRRPYSFYSLLAHRFKKLGINCKLVTGPQESDFVDSRIDITRVDLKELISLLESEARPDHRFIANDSGFAHLAAAMSLKGVVLFFSTEPEIWLPASDRVQAITAQSKKTDSELIDQILKELL